MAYIIHAVFLKSCSRGFYSPPEAFARYCCFHQKTHFSTKPLMHDSFLWLRLQRTLCWCCEYSLICDSHALFAGLVPCCSATLDKLRMGHLTPPLPLWGVSSFSLWSHPSLCRVISYKEQQPFSKGKGCRIFMRLDKSLLTWACTEIAATTSQHGHLTHEFVPSVVFLIDIKCTYVVARWIIGKIEQVAPPRSRTQPLLEHQRWCQYRLCQAPTQPLLDDPKRRNPLQA